MTWPDQHRNVRPFGFISQPLASSPDRRYSYQTLTFDYVGSYNLQPEKRSAKHQSWGGQA